MYRRYVSPMGNGDTYEAYMSPIASPLPRLELALDRALGDLSLDLVILAGLEAEHVGDEARGEDLLAHVELHDGIVVELPGVGDLALGPGQLLLEHEEVLVGLELGVVLGHGKEGLQGAGQHVVGLA